MEELSIGEAKRVLGLVADAIRGEYELNGSDFARAELAFGWTKLLLRTGDAALVLAGNGMNNEAAPLLRTMLEHMTAVALLANDPTQVSNFQELALWQGSLLAKAPDVTDSEDDKLALKEFVDAMDVRFDGKRPLNRDNPVENLEKRLRLLGRSQLYVIYRVLSPYAHPSVQSAKLYLAEPGDLIPIVSQVPALAAMCAQHLGEILPIEGLGEVLIEVGNVCRFDMSWVE